MIKNATHPQLIYIVVLTLALATIVMVLASVAHGGELTTTFRNDRGQVTGTATTNSNGVTNFRDSMGRTTGSAATNSNGITTFRDSMGRTTGSSTTRR